MYVCTYVGMHALTYLIPYKARFLKRTGEWAVCPGLDVPTQAWLLRGTRASCRFCLRRSSLDPLSFREASHGKQQPLPNPDLWLVEGVGGRGRTLSIHEPFVHSIASAQLGRPEKNPTASSQDALKPQA